MKLQPYPAYKDSDVPWLGNVPTHWEVTQAKRYYEIQLGKMLQNSPSGSGDDPVSYLKAQHVQWFRVRTDNLPTMWASRTEIGKYGVQVGDLLVCEGGEGGRSALIKDFIGRIIIQNALHRVRSSRSSTNEFLQYVMYTISTTEWFDAINNKATISHFTKDKFGSLNIPFPPLPEQHAIARFLDHIDGRVNRYIRAKRKLIALLNEQKQAIIHRAVTRGLDPDVPLRPSGVAWSGNVPAHWEVRRIKYLLREVDVRSTTGEETLLSLRMIQGLVPHDEHFARPGQAPTLIGYKVVHPGQIVLNRLQANNGLVFASEIHGVVSPDYAVFDAIGDVDLHYLTALFRTPLMKHKFRIESKGLGTGTAGFLRLYTDRFGMIPVALPPKGEQTRIMQGLEAELTELHAAISRVEREIDLIREYRTRLIADVVTGKLDVGRQESAWAAAAALPEELEEIEPEADKEGDLDAEPVEWEEEANVP